VGSVGPQKIQKAGSISSESSSSTRSRKSVTFAEDIESIESSNRATTGRKLESIMVASGRFGALKSALRVKMNTLGVH
jgi:hypothetical protein